MQIKTFTASSLADVELSSHITDSFKPTLAIIFASIKHDLNGLRALFEKAGIDVFGASSAGEILEDGSGETVFEESIVVMLFDIKKENYRLNMFQSEGKTYNAVGEEVGGWLKTTFTHPAALLMASGMATDGEQIVRGILSATGEEVPLYGGLAGDDMQLSKTHIFDQKQESLHGVIALALDRDKIEVTGLASSGWKAVGGEKIVTKSEGNVVYSIDNIPATRVYREYLGMGENTPLNLVAEYPLQIMRADGNTVMRAALMANTEAHALIYAGSVPQNARVRFCVAPGNEIIEHALSELKQLHEKAPDADALVLFSCKGRHLALGPLAEDEIKPIQELWNVPLIGFYTYGEIGRMLQGKTDFHNETCVLVALKEKV